MTTKFFKKLFSLFIAFIAFANAVQAQKMVSGKVMDADGNPVAGVTVKVKGTTKTTATNPKGEYSIDALDNDVLEFTSVGFTSKETTVKNAVAITLAQQNMGLDEVVVVGYGTQKKRDLTGAVSSVKAKDLVISSGPEIGNMQG